MSEMVQELGTPTMLDAMEANFSEEMVSFGRGLPGGEIHEDPELLWFYTGRPYLNSVTRTHLASDDEQYIDSKIAEVLACFQTRNTSMAWAIGPSTRPTNLTARLEAHGFKQVGDDIQMAVNLFKINENIPSPPELVIKEVEDPETLKIYSTISRQGFDATQESAQNYYENYVANGFGPGKPWHHYIAWLNDKPIAVTSLLFHAGIAGIYGVATIPEARKQGAGAAITLHALREARASGYSVAILAPSKMAIGIYRRIGFQKYGMAYYYAWSPTPSP